MRIDQGAGSRGWFTCTFLTAKVCALVIHRDIGVRGTSPWAAVTQTTVDDARSQETDR